MRQGRIWLISLLLLGLLSGCTDNSARPTDTANTSATTTIPTLDGGQTVKVSSQTRDIFVGHLGNALKDTQLALIVSPANPDTALQNYAKTLEQSGWKRLGTGDVYTFSKGSLEMSVTASDMASFTNASDYISKAIANDLRDFAKGQQSVLFILYGPDLLKNLNNPPSNPIAIITASLL